MFSHVSVHPTIHPSVCPEEGGGGTLARSSQGVPLLGGGTPPWVPSRQTYPGGYPCQEYTTSDTLPSDLAGGTPAAGYPTSGTPHQTWPGVPLPGGYRGYPTSGTPLPPSDLAGGYPAGGGAPHFGKQMEYLIRRCRYAILRSRGRTFLLMKCHEIFGYHQLLFYSQMFSQYAEFSVRVRITNIFCNSVKYISIDKCEPQLLCDYTNLFLLQERTYFVFFTVNCR